MGASGIPVAAIVMTKNEAKNIAKCLKSLHGIDQVFVVDSGSTDGTQGIARNLGATVIDFRWNGFYPKKKQWCLENIPFGHDWVLYVDADEEANPAMLKEVSQVVTSGCDTAGYFIGFDYEFLGKILRHGQRSYKLVLFDRNRGRYEPIDDLSAANMWEVEGHYQPVINGPVATLKSSMLHVENKTLFQYFDRHNRYSDWEATVRLNKFSATIKETQISHRATLKKLFDFIPFKGVVAFIYSYVIKAGFLDGRAGFHFAIAKAFYYWQIQIKIDEFGRQDRSVSQSNPDE